MALAFGVPPTTRTERIVSVGPDAAATSCTFSKRVAAAVGNVSTRSAESKVVFRTALAASYHREEESSYATARTEAAVTPIAMATTRRVDASSKVRGASRAAGTSQWYGRLVALAFASRAVAAICSVSSIDCAQPLKLTATITATSRRRRDGRAWQRAVCSGTGGSDVRRRGPPVEGVWQQRPVEGVWQQRRRAERVHVHVPSRACNLS